ncbi:MFS transporter [Nakamurella flavida]|uniref:MFS transporter n=1 Tax=Nakamurella flavida TaxID=363630 RepID=A0A938YMT0_9ACTN|nr:MFS transporter [Nakamurella flavida]MBM9476247.1 MFS transporter [Nakamurella flavida]MDP9779655.1 dTMP kinase [Nakamurella flavida]
MSRAKPSSFGVLVRIPIFRRLWAAIAISSLGDWLGLLATSALAYQLTQNSSNLAQGAAVSGVLLTRLLPDLLLAPVAGALVDKFDRRKVAIIGDICAGLLYVSIALTSNLGFLYVAQFLVEAIGLFSTPAKQTMWVNIVPRERLAVANQINYVSVYGMVPVAAVLFALLSTIAQFFGATTVGTGEEASATGGLVATTTSSAAITIALLVDAGTYFFSAGTVLLSRGMIPAFVGERSTTTNIFSLVAEGISFVRKNPLMRSIYIGILGAFGAGGLVAGIALPYVNGLGAGDAGFSLLFGSVFTGLALGMLLGPRVLPTVPRRMIFTPAIGAAGLCLIAMSLLQDLFGAMATAALMGMFAGIAWITGFTMIGQEVSDQLRGRVFAFVMSSVRIVLLGTIAVAPVLAGAIGTHVLEIGDFTALFTGPAIVLAIGGVIALGVSFLAGRQIGGFTSGLIRKWTRRRSIWEEPDDHAGVLLAVEGRDREACAAVAAVLTQHLREQGWRTVAEGLDVTVHPVGGDTPSSALRAAADLADACAHRIRPALEAGDVVVCNGFIDAMIVRYRAEDGQAEARLWRLAMWAAGGLRPDLTVLVDVTAGESGPILTSTHSHLAMGPARPRPAVDAAPTDGAATGPDAGTTDGDPSLVGGTPAEQVTLQVTERAVATARPDPDAGSPPVAEPEPEVSGVPPETAATGAPDGGRLTAEEDDTVDPEQAFRDRASYTPERYLIVHLSDGAAAPDGGPTVPDELTERIASVLRARSPVLADPQPV